jgi:hypothetical protein
VWERRKQNHLYLSRVSIKSRRRYGCEKYIPVVLEDIRAEDVLLLELDAETATELYELEDATGEALVAPAVVLVEELAPTDGVAPVLLVGTEKELLGTRVVLVDADDD